MRIHSLHRWDLTPTEAVALQRELASQVVINAPAPPCSLVAGADVSYNKYDPIIYAGVVLLRLPELTVVERRGASVECHFPYIPGLLSFREAPALLAAFAKVESEPNAVMLDGQGIAHPRRLGLASHIGLWLHGSLPRLRQVALRRQVRGAGPRGRRLVAADRPWRGDRPRRAHQDQRQPSVRLAGPQDRPGRRRGN